MSEAKHAFNGLATLDSADSTERHAQLDKQEPSGESYEPGGGKITFHGITYQLKLLTFFLLRGLANGYSFSLATEMKDAQKFDDVVLKTKKKSSAGHVYRLLQAKHRSRECPNRITVLSLMPVKDKGDFYLRQYFESYLKLRPKFTSDRDEIKDLILCTNAGIKKNDFLGEGRLGDAFEEREDIDDIFEEKLLRFKKDFKGREIVIEYLKMLKGITYDEGDIESFLEKLSFAVNQHGIDELDKKNKEMFIKQSGISDTEIVFKLFEIEIREWMTSTDARYFSDQEAKKFMDTLKDKFGALNFGFQDPVWNFVGRERELGEMEMAKEEGRKIIVISGLGGMGKSELARKYIQKHSGVFKRIVWMTADSQESLINSFHRLSKRLGIDVKEKDTKSVVEEVYTYFEGHESVFVLDNVERLNFEGRPNDYLKNFLPSTSKSPFVILTSRLQWNWEDVHNLPLKEMASDDAVHFIKSNLPAESHSSNESVKTLATKLQNFPLALQEAVAYIKIHYKNSIAFGGLYCIDNWFFEEASKILNFGLLSSSRHEYGSTTMSTWNKTIDLISKTKHGKIAVKILKAISYFVPENIDIEKIIFYFGEHLRQEIKKSLNLLKEFSLIDLHDNRISIHRLLQKVIRLRLNETGEKEEILRWALKSVNEFETRDENSFLEQLDEYNEMQAEYLENSRRYKYSCLYGSKCRSDFKELFEPSDEYRPTGTGRTTFAVYTDHKPSRIRYREVKMKCVDEMVTVLFAMDGNQ